MARRAGTSQSVVARIERGQTQPSAATLGRAELWNLVTSAGPVGVAFLPSGTEGYEDLAADAVSFEVFGVELLAASLRDIIRSKEAADRPQDRHDVIILRELLRRESGAS